MLVLVADCHGRIIQFPLKEEYSEVTIGSLPENLISLPYKGVSRRHFSLIRQNDGWLLKDLGSTNGTRLNGSKVKEATIKPDDSILAGVVEFKVKESDTELFLLQTSKGNEQAIQTNRTDRFGDIETGLQQGIFASHKLIFPSGMIPGQSSQMMNIYQRIHSLADSDVNVLFIGETGTGKEMFARMLHSSGKRSTGPFIAVNCAAIPSELLEAELFGIGEKVATDVSSRKGKIELADHGTLFLDELGAFPISLQAKVLRAIEEKIITKIGEHRGNAVDFR
jgi:transcriptional regulator with PAS, ATPase and Fis domain